MGIQYAGGGGAGATTTLYDDLPEGILFAVSIFTEFIALPPRATWASLSITSEASVTAARSTLILQGYLSKESPLSWHGFLPITPAAFYSLTLRGNLNPIFRLEDVRLTFKRYSELLNATP